MPTIIVENDVSEWNDVTGEHYHFPKRYLQDLLPGTPVIYYKGAQKEARFADFRLSKGPYYFGVGEVGTVLPDTESIKGDYFCEILNYRSFDRAVPFRAPDTNETFEEIPPSRITNFWRDGVRPCTQEVFDRIIAASGLVILPGQSVPVALNDDIQGGTGAYETIVEDGTARRVYGTRYERNPRLRARALQIHGVICKGCGFDFERMYGAHGRGYIHVHHLNPISGTQGVVEVNPRTDMTVLCANCHSMVHRYPGRMLSLADLIALISAH